MSFRKDSSSTAKVVQTPARHSVSAGARNALETLLEACHTELPESVSLSPNAVEFSATSEKGDEVHLPTPLREQELAAAIKALEGLLAGAIIELRSGKKSRKIRVNMDRVTGFLMGSYLTTLDGMGKGDPRVKDKIPDTDLNRAQSVLYRRMSANLYQTKNKNEYYHIHGSLNPDPTLTMLNLPTSNPSLTNYHDIIAVFQSAVSQHTAAELDALNTTHNQAGIQALTYPQFLSTPHGRALLSLPFTVRPNPLDTHLTPPVPFPLSTTTPNTHALKGIKVLELCRVIAGPTIGRSLAAHGASVLKITSPHLPDVPFFQLDVNAGKHTIHLDLKTSSTDRAAFETLLRDADVLIDGYRPGALARLGYGPDVLAGLGRSRGKGFVYVAEDCFGSGVVESEWAARPGWQQIADCVTGVAFAQGRFMGLGENEPVVPPFPMSDYGTGALGCVAALVGLYKRATEGGSWVGRRALVSMRRAVPHIFEGERMMQSAVSKGFGGSEVAEEAVEIEGVRVGHLRTARPNGWDENVGWEGWEEDIEEEAL